MSITRLVVESIAPWTEGSAPLDIKTPVYNTVIEDVVLRVQLVAIDSISEGYLCESLDELDAIYTTGLSI